MLRYINLKQLKLYVSIFALKLISGCLKSDEMSGSWWFGEWGKWVMDNEGM